MKTKKQTIIHSAIHLLLFIGVIFAVSALKPAPTTPPQAPRPSSTPVAEQREHTNPTAKTQTASVKTKTAPQKVAATSPKFDQIKETVQQEYVYHMFAAPNDPGYASDWAMAKVNAPAAWDVTTGSGQTVVAVIDGGFALSHEDLVSRWATNANEIGTTQSGDRCWTGSPASKQSNSCDDDNNGYVDDWRGWSFVLDDNNPQAGRENTAGDGTHHATEVAGLAGAAGNNNTGIASLDWNTKIMPLQALDDDGTGYTSSVAAAIYYAVDNGAQVINLSLGTYGNDPAVKTAVNYAITHNVVVVAAAGNCGDGTPVECAGVPVGAIAYPAAYPDVIAVGASTSTDQRAYFSSYGQSLDVVAPGYNVPMSTTWTAGNGTSAYATHLYGTSYASPIVASLASLIKSIRPSTSVADVTALIDATASKPAAMSSLLYTAQLGHGIINAGSALTIAQALNTPNSTPTLLQAGSYKSEHDASAGTTISSGCVGTAGSACTVQFTSSAGYIRYLPYALIPVSGSTGWSWSADMLDSNEWQARARSGDKISTTPYGLLKKN